MGKIKDGFYFGTRLTKSYKKFNDKKKSFVGRQCSMISYFEGSKQITTENLLFLDFEMDLMDQEVYTLRLLNSKGEVETIYFESFAWKYQIETWLVFK